MYDIGDTVLLSTTITDADTGLPVNPASLQLTVFPPIGTPSVLTLADLDNDAAGDFSYGYTATMAGPHRYAWLGAGPGFAETGTFMVWPPLTVLGLADAKDHLNITGTDRDEELRRNIISATDAIENKTGPMTPKVFTQRLWCHRTSRGVADLGVVVLPQRPVLSVDEIVSAAGRTVLVTDPDVFVAPGGVLRFPGSAGQYDITWTAGRTSVPGDLYQALLELLRHLMQPQRGGASRANQQTAPVPGAAYAFPNRVTELIQPHLQYVGA